ncbi:hypothetical protein HPP92_025161 [Vanilla planifolia]|uniref:UspA domain-containing protein n=1 Tax=Vanilla planifolia TaxID=51239 RepID=A0A835U8N4_VANPL|nr:hypothetical protein HPP92_025161 [Vanilla planifolia]
MMRASNDDSGAFLRQLSSGAGGGRGGWDYCSYYKKNESTSSLRLSGNDGGGVWWSRMEEGEPMVRAKKRVMVVVDHGARAKQAMMWALTHVANKGDLLILLHVIPTATGRGGSDDAPRLADTLGALCKECRPEASIHCFHSFSSYF